VFVIEKIRCEICKQDIDTVLYEQHMIHHDRYNAREEKKGKPTYIKEKCKKDENDECKICWGYFKKEEMLVLLKCTHKFHDICFSTWSNISSICPICKKSVFTY